MKLRICMLIFIAASNLLFIKYASSSTFLDIKVTKLKPRDSFKIKLLKLFLKKAKTKYKISFLNFSITKPREFKEMIQGDLVNVGLFTSSIKYESNLIPIRFPIYRGLIGYRIFFIYKNKEKLFKRINTINELKKLVCAQGLNWTDADILEKAGFKVVRIKYINIFRMLNADREIDFFPRGINEIFFEMNLNRLKYPNIRIEKYLMLHYPLGMFFYVSPKYPEIADALKKGLKLALKDGSLKKALNEHIVGNYTIKDILKLSNFMKRKIFEINNPFLTEKTKKILKKYSIKLK